MVIVSSPSPRLFLGNVHYDTLGARKTGTQQHALNAPYSTNSCALLVSVPCHPTSVNLLVKSKRLASLGGVQVSSRLPNRSLTASYR